MTGGGHCDTVMKDTTGVGEAGRIEEEMAGGNKVVKVDTTADAKLNN